jgi:hypothetical protein
MLTLLKKEFYSWEELLTSLSEEQITILPLPNGWTIKDVLAHLTAWQQVSIARLDAARLDREPILPGWLAGSDPESERERDRFNAKIYETYRERPWSRVHRDWKNGFLRFLTLGEEVPEESLMDAEKYPWLKGYALFAVLQGSYEHHHIDHFEPLLAWVRQQLSDENGFGPA